MTDFIFLGFKIPAYGDSSHEIKTCLLLRRKAMTNLDSILQSRDRTLLTKVHLVKAMVFPAVMYRRQIWTIKKAESRRIDASVFVIIKQSAKLCKQQQKKYYCIKKALFKIVITFQIMYNFNNFRASSTVSCPDLHSKFYDHPTCG